MSAGGADLYKVTASGGQDRATFSDYLALARVDHWTKHIFIVPGIVLAYVLRDIPAQGLAANILVGFLSAGLIASANYVMNEWLDRSHDAFHPTKSRRAAVVKALSPRVVALQYLLLMATGLALAWMVSLLFFLAAVAFAVSGVTYNLPPLRSKDRLYLDVLSEAANNPIRLFLGWAMVDPASMPPSSLIVAYWMGGAFLMAAKRLSEYRDFAAAGGTAALGRYRRSFRYYTEERLLVSSFLYAMLSLFCIAVFLVKYRVEYVVALPFIVAVFTVYLALALQRDSVAQRPEKLFREKLLMAASAAAVVILGIVSFVDLPFVEWISEPHFVGLGEETVTR